VKNTITFIYNPYIYFESYKNVLNNVRLYYPDADIIIYMDSFRNDLQKYIEIASKHKCITSIRQNKMFYIHRDQTIDINLSKMVEWVDRIKSTCEASESEWIMLLEDDVLIKRAIKSWPNADCGKNRDRIGFLGGGSVFRRQKFLECLHKSDISTIIRNDTKAAWAGDHLLQYIFRLNGATEEKWVELAEPGYYDDTDHAVFHGYKKLHTL
jgi:hypothetical protein